MAGKDEYKYLKVLGTKGINQQERLANPELELADARNVWAPDGRIEKRPGYYGVGMILDTGSKGATFNAVTTVKESPLGTFTETGTLSSLAAGERWFMGIDSFDSADIIFYIGFDLTSTNSNSVYAEYEYWNGSVWAPLYGVECDTSQLIATKHLVDTDGKFFFQKPNDWAKTTIVSKNYYWIRVNIKALGASALDASVVFNASPFDVSAFTTSVPSFGYFIAAQTTSGYKYIQGRVVSGNLLVSTSGNLRGPEQSPYQNTISYTVTESPPPSYTVIPQFQDVYVAYSDRVILHKGQVNSAADVGSLATIETDPTIVGSNAVYRSDLVPQLGEWPRVKYTLYHRGELWAANFTDSPQQIAWSAASPAYKVWPTANFDILADNDNSPITALAVLEQNIYVFKNDSIWQMVYTGVSGLGLNTYRAEKIVSGTGCVAHGAVVTINGMLFFPAEDGIYMFNGSLVKKVSARIQTFWNTILSGRRAWMSAVHWREKSCYLLSCTTVGSAVNNAVVVYDYKNDSCWIWDSLAAEQLFTIEDSADNDRVYFIDTYGNLFQFTGLHDYGTPIESYIVTQRLAKTIEDAKLRVVHVLGSNLSGTLDVEVSADDEPFLGLTDTEIPFSDSLEKYYDVAQYNVAHYTNERDRNGSVGVAKSGSWFRVKVSNDEKNSRFIVNELLLGLVPTSVRR